MHFKNVSRSEIGGSDGSLRKRVNQALLEMYNTGDLEQLKDKYNTNSRLKVILTHCLDFLIVLVLVWWSIGGF